MRTIGRSVLSVICLLTLVIIEGQAAEVPQRRTPGESRSESFPAQQGGQLEVNSSSGAILINIWEKNEVSVNVEGISRDDANDLQIIQTGNIVRVEYRPKRRGWSSRVRFNIDIPSRYNLDLRTGGGEIEVVGALRGNIRGHTSGGKITLDTIIGSVDMNTSGGDIRTGKIQGGGYLKTSGGDIRVQEATEALDIQTSGGDIILGNIGSRLDARTSGGDISIGNIGGEARVSTSGGDIDIRKISGNANISTSGGTIQLRSASGDIRATTAGGDLELSDISGTVEARTAGGDIFAELKPSGKGRSSLITAAGDVTLYIPAGAKATIQALIRVEDRWRGRRSRETDRRTDDSGWRPGYEIRSDFKSESYEESEEKGEIRAIYTLNGGGERIWLETVNGHINIRQWMQNRTRE